MAFEITKSSSSYLLVNLENKSMISLKAIVNGEVVYFNKETYISNEEKTKDLCRLDYDFLNNYIRDICFISDSGEKLSDKTGMLELLFNHNVEAIHKKIQMRGLPIANGFRYLGSLQGYHWCQSNLQKLKRGDWLRCLSYCLCCSAYRIIQMGLNSSTDDYREVKYRIIYALKSIDVKNMTIDDARWYPSLCFALAQLCLCQCEYSDCIMYLSAMLDRMDEFIKLSPITAYNLSMANCMYSAFLANQKDPKFNHYATNWEKILRQYPLRMEIRMGTMIELQDIYNSWLLNHRIYNQFTHQKYVDHRFKKVTPDEIIDTCMRATPPEYVRRKIVSKYLSRFAQSV